MSTMSTDPSAVPRRDGLLADAALRAGLTRFVRGRVPSSEVDDVVQATLTEALASRHAPEEARQLQRWVYGIARHKCVDFYRHQGREAPAPEPVDGDLPAEPEPLSARDLLRWAERELPEGEHAQSTLEWMLREAGGDQLESIADEEQIPAPRVRQRVARMRRHYRARWAAQVAAIVAAVLLAAGLALLWRQLQAPAPVAEEPELQPERFDPLDRARELRRQAFQNCDDARWQRCLDGLDEARALDPTGDANPSVTEMRRVAGEALRDRSENSPPAPSSEQGPEPRELAPKQIEKKVPPKPVPTQFRDKKSFDKSSEVQMPREPPSPAPTQNAIPKSTQSVLEEQQTWNVAPDTQELSAQPIPDGAATAQPAPQARPPSQASDLGGFGVPDAK